MKILLLGKDGQLGRELQQTLAPLGDCIALNRTKADLRDLAGLAKTIQNISPELIVNAAAYTAVEKAETEKTLAMLVNAEAPAVLAREAAAIGAYLVHYSTDYVFDGSGSLPWKETDQTHPLNVYGQSKLVGEEAIIHSGCRYLIFRTSWVYGVHGNNFVKTILRLAEDQETLRIPSDQIGAPTGARHLAEVSVQAIRATLTSVNYCGLYHIAGSGETSWYDYANFIINTAKKLTGKSFTLKHLLPKTSAFYNGAAKRPLNSRLDTKKLRETFSIHLPHWEEGVSQMLKELL